ncbi:MAG: Holliday junction branch migration protein RuvA [Chitinophagaceae bacterium]|jgi:Holliday junction DNA helicase RuvA|nr:Holliday junction branch migration protein RuvA [Chitinophagaceae bacterium]
MIAQIKGTFLELSPTRVVVEAAGVGYELHISLHTYSSLQGKTEGRLFTFLKISEDAHTLYGFADPDEKEMFVKLIGINGVGAATARMMLSSLRPSEIAHAIISGDARSLERVKGIGKKTAERLVIELRDKLGKEADKGISLPGGSLHNTAWNDALDALTALGIPRMQADLAVKKIKTALPENVSTEEIIKQVLKSL